MSKRDWTHSEVARDLAQRTMILSEKMQAGAISQNDVMYDLVALATWMNEMAERLEKEEQDGA